jgi:hypothetical protein
MFQDFDQLLHATARLHADLQLDIDTSDPDLGVAVLSMADRRMFATVRADRAHCFTLFCDVGAIDPARMPAMCRHLLEANTLLADRGWGCWCIEPQTGHVVYATSGQLSATTPTQLYQTIERLLDQAGHWQAFLRDESAAFTATDFANMGERV